MACVMKACVWEWVGVGVGWEGGGVFVCGEVGMPTRELLEDEQMLRKIGVQLVVHGVHSVGWGPLMPRVYGGG